MNFKINKVIQSISICILIVLFSFIGVSIVNAQSVPQILQVEPSLINIQLDPGKTYNYTLKATNLTNFAMPVVLTLESFDQENEILGGYQFKQESNPLATWTSLSQKELLLGPQEQQEIPLSITIPGKVKLGGYSTVLFLNPVLNMKNKNATKISPKIGVLMLANIGVPDSPLSQIHVSHFKLSKWLSASPTFEYALAVKNNSLYNRSVKPNISLKPLFGEKKEFPNDEKFIFPGKTRTWESQITAPSGFNVYTVEAIVSIGEGHTIKSRKTIIVAPIGLIIVMIFGIALVLLFVFEKKRLSQFFKVLFKG